MIPFLIFALIVAIVIILCLCNHNNNIDEQVRLRSENERERLRKEFQKLCDEKEAEYQKLCDEKEAEYQKLCDENNNKYQEWRDAQVRAIKDTKEEKQKAVKMQTHYENKIRQFDNVIIQKCEFYPHLAVIMADLLTVHYRQSAQYLENKARPAYVEAQRIRELKAETKKIIKEKKLLEYQMAYIHKVIPNIDDIFDSGFIDEGLPFEAETEENTDRVRFYLEPEEYQKLSSAERNQLALDRYIAGRKSKWQIGRDYEMYIGHLYEKKGCSVEYMGIIKGLEDLGRDLIVKKNGKTSIIQCKNWSKEKTIHEKHIFQLFGTVVLYNIEHPGANAKGIFISTTALSETALQVAKELDIQTVQKDHGEFPRIKCNINRSTGEKIYHLPFDQQYDSAKIDKAQGEFYAMTVAEAEKADFRRAFRHFA